MSGRQNASLRRRALFSLATSDAFGRAVMATPGGRALAWRIGRRYVAGPSVDDGLACARRLAAGGLRASIDIFGERVTDAAVADRVRDAYIDLARRLGSDAPPGTWLSLDLSHLAVSADPAAARRRLAAIVDAVPPGARVQLGAEEAALAGAQLDAAEGVDPARVTVTLQANLRRSHGDAERVAAAGLAVRLVKGAYVEHPRDAVPYGRPTDAAFLALAERLAGLGAEVRLATHDASLREACRQMLPGAAVEMLLGVRPEAARALVRQGVEVLLYVPCGPAWLRYTMRRVAEAQGAR